MGARARFLPGQLRRVQRHPGTAPCPAGATRTMIRRILMTGDTVGGVWTYTMELAEALGEHGIQVVLAAMGGPPSEAQRVEADRIPNLDLLASDFKLEWMEDPWRDVAASGRWLL